MFVHGEQLEILLLTASFRYGCNKGRPARFAFALVAVAVILVALILLNMAQFRDPLYEWPGEYASTVLEWGLATAALLFAMPLIRGHSINKDPYSHHWSWLPLIIAVLIAYLLSLAPTFFPDQIPDSLRGPKGGIVVLYKTLVMFTICAMVIRWIELFLTRKTRWQQDSHTALPGWWAPQRAVTAMIALSIGIALFVLFYAAPEHGVLFAISAAISVLVIASIYSSSIAARVPAKIASHKALAAGAAVLSSDLMLDPTRLSEAVETRNPRQITIVHESDELSAKLQKLATAATAIAKQNWGFVVISNLAVLILATGLLVPWIPLLITPAKAIVLNVVIALVVFANSLRLHLHR